MKKGRVILRRILSLLLMVAMLLPAGLELPKRAEAGGAKNIIVLEEGSNGKIRTWGGKPLVSYTYDATKGLVFSNTYHYVKDIVNTYHTMNTVWSKYDSHEKGKRFYPRSTGTEGVDWVLSGVRAYDTEVKESKETTTSTFTYTPEKIMEMLTTLYGELKPGVGYDVYISEVFQLKKRQYKNGKIVFEPVNVYGDMLYDIDAVRNAPKKYGWNWSDTTYNQFEAYYDIPITFYLSGGNINVVCVDMDMYNAELKRSSVEAVVGKTKNIAAEAKIEVGGSEYTFQGVYNISATETCTLDKNGGTASVKLGAGESLTVYFGYKRKPKNVKLNIVCVDKDNTSTVLASSSATLKEGDAYAGTVRGSIKHDGVEYSYANLYGMSSSGCVLNQTGVPSGVS